MIGAALDAEYERLSGKSASDIGRAKVGTSGVGQFLVDTGVTGAQIAADAAANTLVPGAGSVLQGVRSFGEASQEAHEAGASIGQQVTYGGLTAGKDMITEKWIDGLTGVYGKGLKDRDAEQALLKYMDGILSPKTASRLVDISGEAAKPIANYALETLLQSIYNNQEEPLDNYDLDAFTDAIQEAGMHAILSGVSSVYADAKKAALENTENAIEKAMEIERIRNQQAQIRKGYIGSAQQNAEGYAVLLKAYYQSKGDGHRW